MLGIEGKRRPAWVTSLRVENGGGDAFWTLKVICGERRGSAPPTVREVP